MLTLSMHDAKLQYIRNWQALQDFGITYFLVKVGRSRKEVSEISVSNLIAIPELHPYCTHTYHPIFNISYRFHWEHMKIHTVITINSSDLCTIVLPPMLFLSKDSLYNMFHVHVIDVNMLTSTLPRNKNKESMSIWWGASSCGTKSSIIPSGVSSCPPLVGGFKLWC